MLQRRFSPIRTIPGVNFLLFALALALAAPAPAQHPEKGGKPSSQVSQEERRRIREDVDSARGNYGRQDARRGERMAPEERERLRRDVQDASKEMPRRR